MEAVAPLRLSGSSGSPSMNTTTRNMMKKKMTFATKILEERRMGFYCLLMPTTSDSLKCSRNPGKRSLIFPWRLKDLLSNHTHRFLLSLSQRNGLVRGHLDPQCLFRWKIFRTANHKCFPLFCPIVHC